MIRRLNQALRAAKVLLAAGVLAFVGRTLVAPPRIDPGIGADPPAAAPAPEPGPGNRSNEQAFLLRNPIAAVSSSPVESPTGIVLLGALPAEHHDDGAAFIKVGTSETVARKGVDVHGWVLTDLWRDHATFISPAGRRVDLSLELPARR